MAKREALRLKKQSGAPWPWSDDPILNTYKFTNVKREHDRTTRWMRDNWTRPYEHRPAGEIVFNCALFRYFGTIEFAEAIGWRHVWESEFVIKTARERNSAGLRVFTGAYIIPTLGQRGPKYETVSNLILTPLWAHRHEIAQVALDSQSWETTSQRMRRLPGFGGTGFMTKEILQDTMHTHVLANAIDRNTWCPAGPGARRGLNRIHGRPIGTRVVEDNLVLEMRALFERADAYLPSYMPELELHDIQFQLCEFDKYERVRLGEGYPKSKYKRPLSN